MMNILRNRFIKYGVQPVLRISTTSDVMQHDNSGTSKTTVDYQDVAHLSKYGDHWWDPNGEMEILHLMNPLRIKFVRDGLANTGFKETNPSRPLEGIKLLDVGCGGGILSEPLARIGANVTGLDASKELISIAQEHAKLDESLSQNLTYVYSSIEDFSQEKKGEYDAVVASEILEHVNNQELFLKSCSEVLKPNGSIFITTFNKNLISWLSGIVGAEYILRLIPVGTHDWNKFIAPEETRRILDNYDCKTRLIHGILYSPVTKTWSWTSFTTVNYALHAVKQSAAENKN
ncbi:hypothetical protein QAD02_019188 [Eretmocerus hayati]|uniref:Uncharacterized protein n=1 Tax=Eretmocerus hayati TaxID=131215 RepID=A0ACC2PKP3_9HYME|nr:hypothetical protein QAD02_019188 [Eretmocerus hayati]